MSIRFEEAPVVLTLPAGSRNITGIGLMHINAVSIKLVGPSYFPISLLDSSLLLLLLVNSWYAYSAECLHVMDILLGGFVCS